MQVKELTSSGGFLEQAGSIIAAGQSQQSKEVKTKVMTAQYPAERAASVDTADNVEVGQTYQNGLLFTAYEYASRTTPDLRAMRTAQQSASKILKTVQKAKTALQTVTNNAKNSTNTTTKEPVANILMPRSKSDNDTTSHKFNDVGESLITRGNGTATGILSNIASTAVFGAIDAATKGVMADYGEQIYNTSRSMYAGADNRTKTYTWDLTPRSAEDLMQILKIYEIFNFYSYGMTGNSQFAKSIKDQIDKAYRTKIIKPINDATGTTTQKTVMESVTSFLSNVIVVSNPTVWFIQNFGTTSNFDGLSDIFGPAQISNIRFDKASDGNFNGLAIAPNMPSSFVLEITFREILTLNRASVYGEDIL